LVSGLLGAATELGGGGGGVWQFLGQRVSLSRDGSGTGSAPCGLLLRARHRHRRDCLAAGPEGPDVGLPDRFAPQAPAVGWEPAQNKDPAWFFPLVCPAQPRVELHLLRYVEALPEGNRQEGR